MSYIKLKQDKTVYCDCDDTLLMWSPEDYVHKEDEIIWITDNGRTFPFLPHKKHIEFLQRLKLQGYGIVIFSAAGANWAAKVVEELKITDLPDVVMSKPEFVIDDFLDAKKIIKSVMWIHPTTGEIKRST